LATLAIWGGYSAYSTFIAPSPSTLVIIQSLPPIHSFLDLSYAVSGRPGSLTVGLMAIAILVAFRAAVMSLWIAIMVESLRPRLPDGSQPWRDRLRTAALRAAASFRVMIGLEALFLGLAIFALFVAAALLGPGIGGILQIGALIGGIYFLVFAPVVAVADGAPVRASLTLAARAARLRGPRHLLLAFSYLALTLFIQGLPAGLSTTPSFAVWAFTLFMTFIHLSVLGAFVFRWLVVGPELSAMLEQEHRTRPLRLQR
jgi:hypothetical protein